MWRKRRDCHAAQNTAWHPEQQNAIHELVLLLSNFPAQQEVIHIIYHSKLTHTDWLTHTDCKLHHSGATVNIAPELQEGQGQTYDSECQTEKVQRKNVDTQCKYYKQAGVQTSYHAILYGKSSRRHTLACSRRVQTQPAFQMLRFSSENRFSFSEYVSNVKNNWTPKLRAYLAIFFTPLRAGGRDEDDVPQLDASNIRINSSVLTMTMDALEKNAKSRFVLLACLWYMAREEKRERECVYEWERGEGRTYVVFLFVCTYDSEDGPCTHACGVCMYVYVW
jgi:hypothetical protein